MNKKILMPIALTILLLGVAFVSAGSFSTISFKTSASGSDYTPNAYQITYNIQQAGWYLLPPRAIGFVGSPKFPELENTVGDSSHWDSPSYISAKWVLSPFTKKYIAYTMQGERWWLTDNDHAKVYGMSKEEFSSLTNQQVIEQLRYSSLAAGWVYYSKPVTLTFEYYPFNIDRGIGNEPDLIRAKLKAGWNLVIIPPYLTYSELKLGDCNIEKAYTWDDTNQKWVIIPNFSEIQNLNEVDKDDLSGAGVAIKVSEDCTFLAKKEALVQSPPALP